MPKMITVSSGPHNQGDPNTSNGAEKDEDADEKGDGWRAPPRSLYEVDSLDMRLGL